MSPGSLVHTGTQYLDEVQLTAHHYHAEGASSEVVRAPPQVKDKLWLEVTGVHDAKTIAAVGEAYGIHALALEDIMSVGQRPKFQDGESGFCTLRMLQWDGKLQDEQVSLWWTPTTIVSFQERPGDCFGPLRERLYRKGGRMQQMPCSYLAYAIVDAIVDHAFVVLEATAERITAVEEAILDDWQGVPLSSIQDLRREIQQMRRSFSPLREVTNGMLRSEQSIDAAIIPYIHDVHGHVLQALDQLEQQRELIAGLRDLWVNAQATHMNRVMQTLTVVATIFIPLTFMAGIYGMNFSYIPELQWEYGYFALWGLMLIVAALLLMMFKRRGYM